jgi:hypothetical protein
MDPWVEYRALLKLTHYPVDIPLDTLGERFIFP